jgi:hypothetical protein
MTIDHGTAIGVVSPVTTMALLERSTVIAVNHLQLSTRQRHCRLGRQVSERIELRLSPVIGIIVIAANCDHFLARVECKKNIRSTNIAGVYG